MGGLIFMEVGDLKRTFNYRKVLIEEFKPQEKPIYILGSNFSPYKSDSL